MGGLWMKKTWTPRPCTFALSVASGCHFQCKKTQLSAMPHRCACQCIHQCSCPIVPTSIDNNTGEPPRWGSHDNDCHSTPAWQPTMEPMDNNQPSLVVTRTYWSVASNHTGKLDEFHVLRGCKHGAILWSRLWRVHMTLLFVVKGIRSPLSGQCSFLILKSVEHLDGNVNSQSISIVYDSSGCRSIIIIHLGKNDS